MEEFIINELTEKSNKAIANGNKFRGFLGEPPESFTKEQLIQICHLLTDEIEQQRVSARNVINFMKTL